MLIFKFRNLEGSVKFNILAAQIFRGVVQLARMRALGA